MIHSKTHSNPAPEPLPHPDQWNHFDWAGLGWRRDQRERRDVVEERRAEPTATLLNCSHLRSRK